MPNSAVTAAILCLALAVLPGSSHAAARHLEGGAASFAIDSPCARAVTIQPDPGLTGKVMVDATADHEEEMAQLVLDGAPAAKLRHTDHECWEPARESDFEQTMVLTLRVPPTMGITVEESGGAAYTIGALQGPLTLDISGGVKLHAEHSAGLTMDLSGGADLDIGSVDRSVKAEISGGGHIAIGQATLENLSLQVSGGGAFTLRTGTIARATIDLSGAASVQVGGTTGDATVDLSGAGAVRFGKVTGRLTKDISGWGSVTVDKE